MRTAPRPAGRSPLPRVRLTPLRRHTAALITIALAAAFVTVMALAGGLVRAAIAESAERSLAGADLIAYGVVETDTVQDPAGEPDPALLDAAARTDGVRASWLRSDGYAALAAADGKEIEGPLESIPPSDVAPTQLSAGRLPVSAHEIVLEPADAAALGVGVGDTLEVRAGGDPEGSRSVSVVGITAPASSSLFAGSASIRILPGAADSVGSAYPGSGIAIALAPDADPASVILELERSGTVSDVREHDQVLEEMVANRMAGFTALGQVLAVFVVIALVTSAVVIANTFAVTLAQRTRALALLRALGALRRQVAILVLRECLLIGVLGSIAGVLIGHALVQISLIAGAEAGWLRTRTLVPFSLLAVLLPLLSGILVTVIAGLGPLWASTRIPPLAALRQAAGSGSRSVRWGPITGRARGRITAVLSTGAMVLGIGALVLGSVISSHGRVSPGVLLGIGGGMLSLAGALLGLAPLVRPLARALAALTERIGGLPARIAARSIARTPGRSAATIAALLIGTTLMTMLAVGARTAQSTLDTELSSRRPFDVTLQAEAMPVDAGDRLLEVRGVRAVATTERGDIEIGALEPMTLVALTPEQVRTVSHRPDLAPLLADGVVILGQTRADRFGVTDGQELRVRGSDGQEHALRVLVDSNLQRSFVTPATLEQFVAADERTPQLIAALDPPGSSARAGRSAPSVLEDITAVLASDGFRGGEIADTGVLERERTAELLATLLTVSAALLGVAVAVALVGIANTLGLGVIERSGENALLRALGASRRQMRVILAWEGVLLALIGAVLGLALGTLYGVLGIRTLLGGSFAVEIAIPWTQLLVILGLTLAAGALASVLPGRSAARAAPASALAAASE